MIDWNLVATIVVALWASRVAAFLGRFVLNLYRLARARRASRR